MSSALIIAHFERVDPLIATLLKTMLQRPLVSNTDHTTYFSRLAHEIISQQLSSKAAATIVARFMALFEGKKFSPEALLACDEGALRAAGMSWAKVRYVRDLADKAYSGALVFDDFSGLSNQEIVDRLGTVKGIGAWTAEMFLLFTLGREDVFSFGDLTLRKGLEEVYGKRQVARRSQVEKITKRWAPYRSYGSLALWHVIDLKKDAQT